MAVRIWTVSNLLSVARAFLGVCAGGVLLTDAARYRPAVLGLMVVAALTDFLDGLIARRLNQVTELGKIIDPVADKIAIACIGVVLAAQGKIPLWFLALVLIRDAAILACGVYLNRARGTTLQSNAWGKWAVTILAAYLIIAVLDLPPLEVLKSIVLFLGVLMLLISSTYYARRFLMVLRAGGQGGVGAGV